MSAETRRDVATATTGATMLAGGGALRHAGVSRAVGTGDYPVIHPTALVRRKAKGRKLYAAGSALGLVGLAPLGLGVSRLASKDVQKADQKRGFWREGLGGTAEALAARGESLTTGVPKEARATQLGAAVGAGGAGSLAARVLLGNRGRALKPLVTPVAGGLAATASVPATNKIVERKYPGYVVTATGVKRKKKDPVKPSRQATLYRPDPRSFRADIGKADSYLGSRTSYGVQRAAVTAAGHPPIIGPLTAAAAAGRYAPPGQERKHAVRQWALGSGAGVAVGTAGAYAGARRAANSPKFEQGALKRLKQVEGLENKARGAIGMKTKTRDFTQPPSGKITGAVARSRVGKPLFKSPAAAVGATAGFLGAKAATGAVLGQTAISLNQRDQSRYNASRGISKAAGQSKREKQDLANKKRFSAVLSATGGTAGLASVGLLLAKKPNAAFRTGIVGGGLGGANALLNTPIQRKEAAALAPVQKNTMTPRDIATYANGLILHAGRGGVRREVVRSLVFGPPKELRPAYGIVPKQRGKLVLRGKPKGAGIPVVKADALELRNDRKTNDSLIARYGDRGPLPKKIDRGEKMRAYEARYVRHGGHKANKYARRAEVGEGVKNIGLGVATAGGAAWLGARTKRGEKVAAKLKVRAPSARRHLDTVAVGGGVAGGAGEIYSGYANQRQSSYANTPGGVAASALRRMRAYTPED